MFFCTIYINCLRGSLSGPPLYCQGNTWNTCGNKSLGIHKYSPIHLHSHGFYFLPCLACSIFSPLFALPMTTTAKLWQTVCHLYGNRTLVISPIVFCFKKLHLSAKLHALTIVVASRYGSTLHSCRNNFLNFTHAVLKCQHPTHSIPLSPF